MVVPPTLIAQGLSRDELRQCLRKTRQNHVLQHENVIPVRPELIEAVASCSRIGVYIPLGSEARPDAITDWCRAAHKSVYLPWFADRDADMVFRLWREGERLIKGPFGFGAPAADSPVAVPELVIVPLVGFDRALNRIGQGKGHFDRYFARHPEPRRAGLAFSVQEVDALPVEPWDIPLHDVMTECEWISKNA